MGVSIIACTNRPGYIRNLFANYSRQRYAAKELIVIVNNDSASLQPYRRLAATHKQARVYRVPAKFSLGACLNFAVARTRYPYIAKFDDDDYYAPYYLTDCLSAFKRTGADIVGKRTHFMYLQGSRKLLLRFPHYEHRYVDVLPGATLVVKRHVFRLVKFPNRSVGEDDQFCKRSKAKGFRIYSAGRHNFVAMRRKNSRNHTWIISDKTLIAHHKTIGRIRNVNRYVQRKPGRAGP